MWVDRATVEMYKVRASVEALSRPACHVMSSFSATASPLSEYLYTPYRLSVDVLVDSNPLVDSFESSESSRGKAGCGWPLFEVVQKRFVMTNEPEEEVAAMIPARSQCG